MSKTLEQYKKDINHYLNQSDYQESLLSLKHFQEAFPDYCLNNEYFYLRLAESNKGLEKFQYAEFHYRQARELAASKATVTRELAYCLQQTGKVDEALQLLDDEIISATENDYEAVKYLCIQKAAIYYERKDFDVMYSALETASQFGGMDLDVMEHSELYGALVNDSKFQTIFALRFP